jgi:hypothetical protein
MVFSYSPLSFHATFVPYLLLKEGTLPLHIAAYRNHVKVVDLLLSRGANIESKTTVVSEKFVLCWFEGDALWQKNVHGHFLICNCNFNFMPSSSRHSFFGELSNTPM